MAKEYNTGNKNGMGSVFQTDWNSPFSGNPLLNGVGWLDDIFGFLMTGDPDSSTNLINEYTGYSSQQREFEQQEYLQDKENEYNLPANQMARMKAAGINPMLAAGGIAKSGNESASAPAVNTNTQGSSSAVGSAASLIGSVGSAAQAIEQAKDLESTRELRKEQLRISNAKMFEELGFTRLQSQAMSIQLQYMDDKERLSVAMIASQIDDIVSTIEKKNAEIGKIYKDIEYADAQIELAKASKNLVKAQEFAAYKQGLKNEAETIEQNWTNQFMQNYSVNPKLPVINGLISSRLSGNIDVTDKIAQETYNYNYLSREGLNRSDIAAANELAYNRMSGELKAQAEQTYDIELNKLKASKDVDLEYGNRLAVMEANKERIIGMASIYSKNVDGVNGFIGWFLQSLVKMPTDIFNSFMFDSSTNE